MPSLSEFYKSRALQLLESGKATRTSHFLRAARTKTQEAAANVEASAESAVEVVASTVAPGEQDFGGAV